MLFEALDAVRSKGAAVAQAAEKTDQAVEHKLLL